MKRSVFAIVLLLAAAGGALVFRRDARQPPRASSPPLQIAAATSPAFSPLIRVALTSEPVASVPLQVDGAFQVKPVGSSRVLKQSSSVGATTATATSAGIRIGADDYPVGRIELVPDRSPAVWIDRHQYRGRVRLFRQPDGKLLAVNVLPLEEYVGSVVDSEMPADFGESARQAQGVVARTYALYQMQQNRGHPYFDLYASPRSQKYLGFQYRDAGGRRLAGESESSRRAVRDTAGMVCTWQGRLMCTYYSAVCGGRTSLGTAFFADAAPPLNGVSCDWCRDAPLYRWTVRLSRDQLSADLGRYFSASQQPFGQLTSIRRQASPSAGGIDRFVVGDGPHQYTIAADELRRQATGGTLYSHRFTIHEAGPQLEFEGQGHGHGVGLCQWGARGLAQSGKTCLEILGHYYPGSSVVVLRP